MITFLRSQHPNLRFSRSLSNVSIPFAAESKAHKSDGVNTVSLLRDGVFKTIFSNKENTECLHSFLETVSLTNDIGKIQLMDPYFPAYSQGEKDIYVDVVCKSWDKEGKNPQLHVVEMQQVENEGYVKRWEFYASRCYTNELLKAKTYDNLVPTHVVALMVHPCKYPADSYSLVGKASGATITESRTLTLISLAEVTPELSDEDQIRKKWLHLIKFSGTPFLNRDVLMPHPIFRKTIDELQHIKHTGLVHKKQERVSRGAPWHLLQKKIRNQISS